MPTAGCLHFPYGVPPAEMSGTYNKIMAAGAGTFPTADRWGVLAGNCRGETLEGTDSRLGRNCIRIAHLRYGVTCQNQNAVNRSATDLPRAIHKKQPRRDGPLPADDQYPVEYDNLFLQINGEGKWTSWDQWGKEVGFIRSMGRGNGLHEISSGEYIRCFSVHTDVTRWTKVELSSMKCLARGMISSMRSARSCKMSSMR